VVAPSYYIVLKNDCYGFIWVLHAFRRHTSFSVTLFQKQKIKGFWRPNIQPDSLQIRIVEAIPTRSKHSATSFAPPHAGSCLASSLAAAPRRGSPSSLAGAAASPKHAAYRLCFPPNGERGPPPTRTLAASPPPSAYSLANHRPSPRVLPWPPPRPANVGSCLPPPPTRGVRRRLPFLRLLCATIARDSPVGVGGIDLAESRCCSLRDSRRREPASFAGPALFLPP
jgi:hypothetical protein